METQSLSPRSLTKSPYVLATFALLLLLVSLNSWVSDDAYITFRFLDNFKHGFGLRWNIDERVQAYTHPLWMFLHIPLYMLWNDIFGVTIVISLICTAAAVAIGIETFNRKPHIAVICFLMPLMLSKIFLDFSTSGLENPLSHLLFACFGYLIIKKREHPRFWFLLSLNVALAMLNRLDVVILFIPPLIWLCLPRLRSIRYGQVALGATPLVLWFMFSLFYYGFLFPNTKYAKLSTGIPTFDYAKQGVLYFFELFSSDAFSYMILCVLLARIVDSVKDILIGKTRKEAELLDVNPYLLLSIGLGALAYMFYVTLVGGDFMSGRFLALPYFVTVWLIYANTRDLESTRAHAWFAFLIILKGLSISMASDSLARCIQDIKNPYPLWGPSFCAKSGIVDERAFYYPARVLYYDFELSTTRVFDDGSYKLSMKAMQKPDNTYVFGSIGLLGYYAPKVRFIDFHALADPLLARLPIRFPHEWRIGHFERAVPDGYIFARRYGRLDQMHPALAAYYAPLRLIVSGDLLDPERLKAIVDFNLGRYDHFKEEYLRAESAIVD